jgi:hypothetical protein
MNLRIAIFTLMCALALVITTFFFRNPISSAESLAWIEQAPAQPAGEKTPVIIELFTSEGCSSCPPADVLLSQLEEKQPVAGVEIIALSEHVDYWNRLGWADPYSSALFSQRQSEYSQAFGLRDIYTPQMVVDGRVEFVGSQSHRARQVIGEALKTPKAKLSLRLDYKAQAGEIPVSVGLENLPPVSNGDSAELLLVIAENNLHSNVSRGENSGRKLAHTAVVRKLQNLGRVESAKQDFTASLALERGWNPQHVKVVAFVQERQSRRILGAASLKLTEPRNP